MFLEPYFLLKLAHILLFVYWLGADIGVFHSAGYVRNRGLGLEARRTALQILAWIDQIPRYCLVLMLPVGYSLAAQIGVARLPAPFYVILWTIALLWLWVVWAVQRYEGTPLAEKLRKVDLYWRWLLAVGLCYDAWDGLRGTGHLLTDWISAKFLLFALLIFCGIMIRVRGRPLAPALRQVLAGGSTPELEAVITGTFAKTRPFVLAIWILLVVAAWIGISKPQFGG